MLAHQAVGTEITHGCIPWGASPSAERMRWIFHNDFHPSRIYFLGQDGVRLYTSSITLTSVEEANDQDGFRLWHLDAIRFGFGWQVPTRFP